MRNNEKLADDDHARADGAEQAGAHSIGEPTRDRRANDAGDLQRGEQDGDGIAVVVDDLSSIEQHRAVAHVGEIVSHLETIHRGLLRDDCF